MIEPEDMHIKPSADYLDDMAQILEHFVVVRPPNDMWD